MIVLNLLEWLAIIIGTLLVISQIVVPLIFGGRTWWLFRESTKSIAEKQEELRKIEAEKKAVSLDKEVKKARQQLDRAKNKTKGEKA